MPRFNPEAQLPQNTSVTCSFIPPEGDEPQQQMRERLDELHLHTGIVAVRATSSHALSRTETWVVGLTSLGQSAGEAALTLDISFSTARTHLNRSNEKLGFGRGGKGVNALRVGRLMRSGIFEIKQPIITPPLADFDQESRTLVEQIAAGRAVQQLDYVRNEPSYDAAKRVVRGFYTNLGVANAPACVLWGYLAGILRAKPEPRL